MKKPILMLLCVGGICLVSGCATQQSKPAAKQAVTIDHYTDNLSARVSAKVTMMYLGAASGRKTDLDSLTSNYGMYRGALTDLAKYLNSLMRMRTAIDEKKAAISSEVAKGERDIPHADMAAMCEKLHSYSEFLDSSRTELDKRANIYRADVEALSSSPGFDPSLSPALHDEFQQLHNLVTTESEAISALTDSELNFFSYIKEAEADGNIKVVNDQFKISDATTTQNLVMLLEQFQKARANLQKFNGKSGI